MYFFRWTAFFFLKSGQHVSRATLAGVFSGLKTQEESEKDRIVYLALMSSGVQGRATTTGGPKERSHFLMRGSDKNAFQKKNYMHVIKTRTLSVLNRRVTRLTSETSSPCSLTD